MKSKNTFIVTGGAGFIGSNFILKVIKDPNNFVINYDLLTYAGNLNNLKSIENNQNYFFVKGDIGDSSKLNGLFDKFKPNFVVNFAAETHVDRSILNPKNFLDTNILGLHCLLNISTNYFKSHKKLFKFLNISTDEVYGSLNTNELPFNENNQFKPNSPYSASKASGDHLVRSYNKTFGLPTLTSNCSNNYGPMQFPEKLIPLVIINYLNNKKIPVYGDGKNIRDWLYVEDHIDALQMILSKGEIGDTYNIGGENEFENLHIIKIICDYLDNHFDKNESSFVRLVNFVKDREGHDFRYAIDSSKINKKLGWKAKVAFNKGIDKTIKWYLNNNDWLNQVQSRSYQKWINQNYL